MGISGSLRSWSTCHLNVPASQLYAMFQLWIHSTLPMDANGATLSILWPLSRLLSKRLPALWCKAQQVQIFIGSILLQWFSQAPSKSPRIKHGHHLQNHRGPGRLRSLISGQGLYINQQAVSQKKQKLKTTCIDWYESSWLMLRTE